MILIVFQLIPQLEFHSPKELVKLLGYQTECSLQLDHKLLLSQVELKLRTFNATVKIQLAEMTMLVESHAQRNNIVSAGVLIIKATDVSRKTTIKNQLPLDKKQPFVLAQPKMFKLEILHQVLLPYVLLQVYPILLLFLNLKFAEYD